MMTINLKVRTFLYSGLLSAVLALTSTAALAVPEADARIKTLVYNDNEVFRIVARSGFQTNIELGVDETIDTLSIGDSIGWQITPASHRLFIKPLQKTGITNLSVITNRRTYQFELVASNPVSAKQDHAYVVRFYYPDSENSAPPPIDRTRGSIRPVNPSMIPELPTPPTSPLPPVAPITPPTMPGDVAAPPLPPTVMAPPQMPGDVPSAPVLPLSGDGYNFNYTLTGPDASAPSKIYDDGRSTFFQFRNQPSPAVNYAIVNPDGTETQVPSRLDADGKVIVDRVASKFTIRDGGNLVCVYNEQANAPMLSAAAPQLSPSLVVPPARP